MAQSSRQTKHVFVTGGVASSLGKGLTASSLGSLLKARGLRVTMQKLDPYLNVDPGTMNPFQHGEVFVTEDGAETDLDIGHYERFLDTDLRGIANVTTGQVYSTVIAKERRGEYLGDTVQVIPHITNEIKARIRAMAARADDPSDVVITEVGGTVGDIESLPFLEAARQVRHDVGRDNCFFLHVSLVPYIAPVGRAEDQADPALGRRAALHRHPAGRDRLPLRPGDPGQAQAQDLADVRRGRRGGGRPPRTPRRIYDIPKVLHTEGLDAYVVRRLGLPFRDVDWTGVGRPAASGCTSPSRDGHRRAGRQVRRPAGRLPVGDRGAAGRRVRPRGQGRDPLGALRRLRHPGRRRGRAGRRGRRAASPAASASAASRARSARSGTPGSTASRPSACASACSAW